MKTKQKASEDIEQELKAQGNKVIYTEFKLPIGIRNCCEKCNRINNNQCDGLKDPYEQVCEDFEREK